LKNKPEHEDYIKAWEQDMMVQYACHGIAFLLVVFEKKVCEKKQK
jgi:hypothetical protein